MIPRWDVQVEGGQSFASGAQLVIASLPALEGTPHYFSGKLLPSAYDAAHPLTSSPQSSSESGDYAGACTCRITQATWVRPGVLVADHTRMAPGFTLGVVTILVSSTVSPGWVTKSTTIW